MSNKPTTFFAPELIIPSGVMQLDFYHKAFNAVELRRFSNDDGSIHVSEMEIDGALFHFHEERPANGNITPQSANGVTTIIGLMVQDMDAVMERAVAAGATVKSPAQSYDYGYRQGTIIDPFGHYWQIEMVI
jgi:PhnB protein